MLAEYQKFMFPIELIAIVILALGLLKIKSILPDLFFPPTNVSVYLPPQQEDVAIRKSTKTQLQLSCLKSNAQAFIKMPFMKEIETSVLFCLILAGHFIIVEFLKILSIIYFEEELQDSGMLTYFSAITLFMIIGNIFNAATIGGLKGYETRMAIGISILCTIAVLVLFFGFRDFIDINMRHEFQRQSVHINVILYNVLQQFWLERLSDIFILILAVLSSIIMFCLVPVIIRFGNCWTELKNPQSKYQQQPELPKYIFFLMTIQLLLPLPIIALNLNSFTKSLPPQISPLFLQCLLLMVLCFLQAITYRIELDRHMFKGRIWAKTLIQQPELLIPVQRKIEGLLKGMVVVSYQLFAKIVIPLLFMTLLLQKSQSISYNRHLEYPGSYMEKDFFTQKNNASIIDNIKGFGQKCSEEQIFTITSLGLPKALMRKVQQYTIVSKSFIYTIVQFFFFNYMFLTFVLSIFYIFFVNKTQTVGTTNNFDQDGDSKSKETKKELKKEMKKQIKA